MLNQERYFEKDGVTVKKEMFYLPWLQYLVSGEDYYWNAERIEKMADKKDNAVLRYVMRTLDILDSVTDLQEEDYQLIRTVLCWSEVAKAGSAEDRKRWRDRGYPLEIHNEASAMIYLDHTEPQSPGIDPVYILVKTHGLAGQFIRGECRMESSRDLILLTELMSKERFCRIIEVLNRCIIEAVSKEIYLNVKDRIKIFGEDIYKQRFRELESTERLHQLLPNTGSPDKNTVSFFHTSVFPKYDLWYFQSALEPFGMEGAYKIVQRAIESIDRDNNIRHINFKPLADEIYYDYEGKKHINTYKQRIIEKYIADPSSYQEHVFLTFIKKGIFLEVGVHFTPVCEKMIEFCVEAERSHLLSYEKCITLLFDTFGFRRDAFDRLNNEEKYLKTMNAAETSTKLSILDYVIGQKVVDVGSGGGVLLNALEDRYPDKTIIGTDISANVILSLELKKDEEGRHWLCQKHNFVDSPFEEKVDTILFSSIIHEIYSYTDLGNGLFDYASIKRALQNAADSLNKGGRIIIRDGIKTPGSDDIEIHFKKKDGLFFFKEYLRDFKGMDRELTEDQKVLHIDDKEKYVITDINFGREFLYTYTWGKESYAHEVQECFGYYEIKDFVELFEKMGFKILRADSFLEPGYPEHLSPLVELCDPISEEPVPFPDSNCIIVAEKL